MQVQRLKHRDGLNNKTKQHKTHRCNKSKYLLPTNVGRTQLVLVGTLNANRDWRAASFVKTCNALKVIWWMTGLVQVVIVKMVPTLRSLALAPKMIE